MRRFTIHIPASISLSIVTEDGREPTKEQISDEVGRFITLKNGQDFDSDEFEIIDDEEWED